MKYYYGEDVNFLHVGRRVLCHTYDRIGLCDFIGKIKTIDERTNRLTLESKRHGEIELYSSVCELLNV